MRKKVRLISLATMAVSFLAAPIVGVTIWLAVMKQYNLKLVHKLMIFIVCGVIGTILAFLGIFGNLDVELPYWPFMAPALVVGLAPSIFSLIWPGKEPTAASGQTVDPTKL